MTRLAGVAVEAWLGPMEGLGYVAPYGNGPTVIHVGRSAVDKKRNTKNELVLPYDGGISVSHAEIRVERGRLFLTDAGSTNGTLFESGKVTGEVDIQSGDIFVVSWTPVRVRFVEGLLPEMPFPSILKGSAWPDPRLQGIVRRAWEAATRRGELFIDTRHLCEAVLRSSNPSLERLLREATWSKEQALIELWEGRLLVGRQSWLNDLFLRPAGVTTGSDELILSARAGAILEQCQQSSVASSTTDVETMLLHDLLRRLRQDSESAVGGWLARRLPNLKEDGKPAPPPVPRPAAPTPARLAIPELSFADRQERTTISGPILVDRSVVVARKAEAAGKAAAARSSRISRRRLTADAPAAGLAGSPLSPDEVGLDRKARELADELLRESAAYRFSTPGDRRAALKAIALRELHALAPGSRPRLLDQLRLQFPVAAPGQLADAEETRLRRRVAELEKRLAEAEARPDSPPRAPSAEAALPWPALLTPRDEGIPALDPALALLREVLRFCQDVETFVLGHVEAMTMPGAETQSFRLPNFRNRLLTFLAAVSEGKQVDLDEVREYLVELRRWQIAISAGQHEAPKLWFAKLWKKINPTVIETATHGAAWKLRGETAEWWDQYRNLVKDLNPDLVQDQVLQASAQLAQMEFQKLNKRR
jgi:hypothetical protein